MAVKTKSCVPWTTKHYHRRNVCNTRRSTSRRTESTSRRVAVAAVISAESLGVRRLRSATFLVVLLHQRLRLVPLKLYELHLVEQYTFFRELEVGCVSDIITHGNRESTSATVVCCRHMRLDTTDRATRASIVQANVCTILSRGLSRDFA